MNDRKGWRGQVLRWLYTGLLYLILPLALLRLYWRGRQDAGHRQRWREQILGATQANFHAFGETLAGLAEQGLVVVLGSPEAIERANAERGDGWLDVKKIL